MKAHKPDHFVQRFKLDFQIWDQQEAVWIQNEMARLFRQYLKHTLERILDEFDSPDYLIRIDTLELDLGPILHTSLERRVPKLFEEKLYKAMADILGRAGRKIPLASSQAKVFALTMAKMELLANFLVTGQSVYGHKAGNKTMEDIFLELLAEDSIAVIDMVSSAFARSPKVAERMAFQFQHRTFEEIYKIFAPAFRSFLISQEGTIANILTVRTTSSPTTARRIVRVAILNYLLPKKGKEFEPEAFRRAVVKNIVDQLGNVAKEAFRDQPELVLADSPQAMDEARRVDAALKMVSVYLREGKRPSDLGALLQAWDLLSLEVPRQLAGLFRQATVPPHRILELVKLLPFAAAQDFIGRILPIQATQLNLVLAEVLSIFQAYSASPVAGADVRDVALAEIIRYSTRIADAPQSFSLLKVIEGLAEQFDSRQDVPAELKQALKKLDLPGLSEAVELARQELESSSKTDPKNQQGTEAEIEADKKQTEAEEKAAMERAKRRLEAMTSEPLDLTKQTTPADASQLEEWEALAKEDEIFREAQRARENEQSEQELMAAVRAQVEAEVEVFLRKKFAEEKAKQIAEQEESAAEGREVPVGKEDPDGRQTPEGREKKEEASREEGDKKETRLDEYGNPIPVDSEIPELTYREKEELAAEKAKLVEQRIEQAFKAAKQKLEDEKKAEEEKEALRRLRKPVGQDGTNIPVTKLDEEEPFFDTVAARIDYVEFFLRHGVEPWWIKGQDDARFELAVATLLKVRPDGLKAMLLRFMASLPQSQVDVVVARLIAHLGSTLITQVVALVIPEIGGFAVVMAEALAAFIETPDRKISLPSHIPTKRAANFHHMLKFALVYQSSSPNLANMVRYVAREFGNELDAGPRAFIRELIAVLDTKIAKGDKRFVALKTMLPLSFQEIVVDAPLPLEAPEGIAYHGLDFIAALLAEEAVLEGREPSLEAIAAQFESQADAEKIAPRQELPKDDVIEKDGETSLADPEKTQEAQRLAALAEEERIANLPEAERKAIEAQRIQLVAEAKAELAREEARILRDAFRFEPDAPRTVTGDEGAVVEDDEEAQVEADTAKAIAELAPYLDEAKETISSLPRAMRYFRNAEDSVDVIRHFLLAGSMPGDFPVQLSVTEFEEFFQYVFKHFEEKVLAMLRKVALDRLVRLRMIRQLPGIIERIILALMPSMGAVMVPFAQTLAALVEGYSAPIRANDVLEHALAYAIRVRGEIFSPLDYVKSLIQYMQRQLSVDQRTLVSWFETQLEQRQLPQKFALQQVLRTIRTTSTPTLPEDDKRKKEPAQFKPLEELIFVPNAGMVMVWPFYGQLFGFLKLLNPDKRSFVDDEKRAKAAHILDYIVSKEINHPEETMMLNKVLVGMELDEPMMQIEELSDEEKELIEEMMGVAAQRSGVMKNGSADGLRETFMQREGRLKKEKDGWHLRVEAKAYDLILGRLQWGFNPVKIPWLTQKLTIEWK